MVLINNVYLFKIILKYIFVFLKFFISKLLQS